MADLRMMNILLILFFNFSCISGRIHHLELKVDDRPRYTLSSFGFLKHGTLTVNVTDMIFGQSADEIDGDMYGFTLDVSSSTGASSYIEENYADKCIFNGKIGGTTKDDEKTESIVVLKLDLKKKKILIERHGEAMQNLIITNQTHENFWRSQRRRDVSRDHSSDSYLFNNKHKAGSREKREVKITHPPPKKNQMDEGESNGGTDNADPQTSGTSTTKPGDTSTSNTKQGDTPNTNDEDPGKSDVPNSEATGGGSDGSSVSDSSMAQRTVYTELPMSESEAEAYSFFFMVAVTEDKQEGMYTLNFHNCQPPEVVSYTIDITEVNSDGVEKDNYNYLSASKMPLPTLYFMLSLVYIIMAIAWNTVLCKSKESVYKMHYLMMVVVFVKSLSCLFHAINFHFIQKEGIHEEAWAVLFYIAYLTRGALLFVTIILIGAGWAFIKHVLSEREKKLFLIVIPLQILDNIAWIIVEESEEGQSRYSTWKEIFILIDLLCCGAILFPVVWSIKHLQDASRADGKAEFSLTKLKLFRQFYIMVVCYIYFTRIIVYLLEMTVPFKYEWLHDLFREMATIMFFIITAYKFRPATDNPYLQVPSDDEDEMEMDQVIVGQSSTLDTVKKVNQNKDQDSTGVKLRESSHEYD